MAAPIGTSVAITWASGANPAAQNVTPPVGCNAVYMFWSYYAGDTGYGLLAASLDGVAPDQTHELPTSPYKTATGVCVWYNPPTGSAIPLDVEWDAAPLEGPLTAVAFVEDADTAGWRDVDSANVDGSTQQTLTLTTVSGDLVLAFDERYTSPSPANESGYTSLLTTDNNLEYGRLRYIVASGATQTAATQDTNYSSIVAVVIPDAPPGGGPVAAPSIFANIIRNRPG